MIGTIALGITVVATVVGGAVYAAFRLSPWPKALLIRRSFEKDAAATKQALEKHVPEGVAWQLDLRYDDADPDAYLDLYYPADLEGTDRTLPAIVWVHGGAWISCSKSAIANYLKILAGQGYATVGVGYSIAPRITYPTPVRQVLAALGYLAENGRRLHIDASRLVLAGDSAGAQIAAQVANIVSCPSYAGEIGIAPTVAPDQLKAVVLFCGVYDARLAELDGPAGDFHRTVLWSYSGRKDFAADPLFAMASVAEHVTAGFPPAFISAGNDDPLAPQSLALAEALTAEGVAVDALFFADDYDPPLHHGYQFNLDLDAGHIALDRVTAFLGRWVGVNQAVALLRTRRL